MFILKYPSEGRISREGVLVKWFFKEGQPVKKGNTLLQIETASEQLQVECEQTGLLLKSLCPVGYFVRSGDPLAVIGQENEDVSKAIEKLEQQASFSEHSVPPIQEKTKTKDITHVQPVVSQTQTEEVMTSAQAADHSENVIPILMPQAGQSMEEGTILSWKVKEGDTISVGQVIMEIETDKATMEVEATDAGRIAKIVEGEGAIVEVKKPVAFIADNNADVDAFLGVAPSAAPAPKPASATVSPNAPAQEEAPTQPAVSMPEGAVVPVLMPQAGQSMEEGTILSWKVKEGDVIEVGQVIMEIETDKATMEVESVDAGRIAKIVAFEGDIVEVKKPVAYLAEEGVDVDGFISGGGSAAPTATSPAALVQPIAAQKPTPVQKSAAQVSDTGRVKASPAARKAAKQKGIDLNAVSTGSGPGGRILSTDIEQAGVSPTGVQVHPLTKMRRAIAINLLYSKQNIPHFYATKTIDAGPLFTTYRKTKEQFKCSVNDFVTMACAKAVRQYPPFRSQYKDNEVHEHPAVNIGIAVGTDQGLTVPVVLNVDQLPLEQLAAQTRQVVESARNGKLENFGHGVFTITNLGMFGCEEFSAIINPPESAILAVGAIVEGVKVENEQIRPTRLMTMTLSVDHRVIDGVLAAQFLNTVQELLEKPEQLVS